MRNGLRGGNLEQEMDVVLDSADGVDEDIFVFADAGREIPEFVLKGRSDGFEAVFCGEDEVDGVFGIGMRHEYCYVVVIIHEAVVERAGNFAPTGLRCRWGWVPRPDGLG